MPVELKVLVPAAAATINTSLVHEREKLCQEAEFASRLVRRAVVTTNLAFRAYREAGWIIDMPPIDDLIKSDDRKTGF